jgi:hypothetical protein
MTKKEAVKMIEKALAVIGLVLTFISYTFDFSTLTVSIATVVWTFYFYISGFESGMRHEETARIKKIIEN